MARLATLPTPPLWNCFWLMLPVIAFNAAFAGYLPAAFQPEAFQAGVPPGLVLAENALRTLAVALTPFMPINLGARGGLALYAAGVVAYLGAWAPLLLAPGSVWSASAAGFLAPALMPALWLAGIGIVGAGRSRALTGVYAASAAAFLAAHVAHALIVLPRPA